MIAASNPSGSCEPRPSRPIVAKTLSEPGHACKRRVGGTGRPSFNRARRCSSRRIVSACRNRKDGWIEIQERLTAATSDLRRRSFLATALAPTRALFRQLPQPESHTPYLAMCVASSEWSHSCVSNKSGATGITSKPPRFSRTNSPTTSTSRSDPRDSTPAARDPNTTTSCARAKNHAVSTPADAKRLRRISVKRRSREVTGFPLG